MTDQLICAVCAGEANGVAIVDRHGSVRWRLCGDPMCADIAKRWNDRGEIATTPYENEAVTNAGRKAGKHLVALGVTDMARLSREEWAGFVSLIVSEYRSEVSRLASEQGPPF